MTTDIEMDAPDYVAYVHQLAADLKGKLTGNTLTIPPALGQGYIWAENLPSGISIMVAETQLNQPLNIVQKATPEQYFSLQFIEYTSDSATRRTALNRNKFGHELHSAARLSHTLVNVVHHLYEDVKMQSVRFYFKKQHLLHLLGEAGMEEMITNYFPFLISNEHLEPIATEFRMILNELQMASINVPLRLNYIQNRVQLLLERYILIQFGRKDIASGKFRRTDDETVRLARVEALLVRNFSVAPPTIDELSRISAMSPTKLKNDFKKQYGFPIYEYFQMNRMLKAKSLLLTGKFSIKEVGIMVGYTNLSHFASGFKKQFKILPREVMAKDGVLVYNS